MNGDNPLSRKISTLASQDTFSGAALKLGSAGSPDAINHVLQAIDDTMMLRDAVFSVGESSVTLRVSGKRVLMVSDISDDLRQSDGLVQQPLSADTPDAVAELGSIIRDMVSKSGTLTLERKVAGGSDGQAGSGVGVQALSASWAAAPAGDSVNTIEGFVKASLAISEAMIIVNNGEREAQKGDQLKVDLLSEIYDEKWALLKREHYDLLGEQSDPGLYILDAFGPVDQALVIVEMFEKQYLMLVLVENVEKIIVSFSELMSPA